MDEQEIQEEIDRASAIGLENLEILKLAANWCEHIGLDNARMGVGLIEQATGLPISGGSLRCEFANAPRIFGMVLSGTAVGFYEENCIGCPHHKPTGRTPNLGTWADAIIVKRNEEARRAEEERRTRAEQRAARAAARRFTTGAPDPAVQSILDLVDRIDAEDADPEAASLLLKSAELSPQDLPDRLLEQLAAEAIAIRRGVLLEVVFKVFELSGRPPLETVLSLAFAAVANRIAAAAGGRIIAANALAIPTEPAVRRGISALAAGSFSFHHSDWTGGEPAALIHFFDVDSGGATESVAELLRDAEPWTRATGANAARALVRARPSAGQGLLPTLLDCVVAPDGSRALGEPHAASTAGSVVADILIADPSADDAIVARMQGAPERQARALWKCYWQATPSRFREPVPDEAIGRIERRAVSLLREERPLGLLQEVSDTLSHLTDDHGAAVGASISELIDLLRWWNAKVEEASINRPSDPSPPLAFLEWENQRIRITGIARDIEEAIEGRAKGEVIAYVNAIEPLWDLSGPAALTDDDKASLLNALSVIRSQEELDRASALITRVVASGEVLERAAALGALEDLGWRDLTIPGPIQRLIVSNMLTHDKLWVRIFAIRALPLVEVEPDERPRLVELLVNFAFAYKREPLRSDDVERALRMALRLSETQDYGPRVKELALSIINGMPSSEAADALEHLHALRTGPEWVAAVIRALERDDRGDAWYGVHERQKEDLLHLLAEAPAAWLERNWDALEAAANSDLDLSGSWTWAVADLFARHGLHERAATLAQAIVDNTPDTRESRPRRRMALLVTYGHRINAAANDPTEAQRLVFEAAALAEEDAAEDA